MRPLAKIGLISAYLFGVALSSRAGECFHPIPGGEYRLENQFSGMTLTGYLRKVLPDHWTNDSDLRTWAIDPTGTPGIFYLKQMAYPGWAYASGDKASLNYKISAPPTDQSADQYKWKIQKVLLPDGRDVGLYSIQNVGSGLYLTFDVDLGATDLRGEKAPIKLKAWTGNRPQLWKFIHVVKEPIETLAVPQGGWDVYAINKCALLCRNSQSSSISYSVSGPQSASGTAIYWGQYWNDKYYYIINLNSLTQKGTYTLTCDGKKAIFRIGSDIYIRPYRSNGRDRFSITDLFDNDYGFVGHWGRNANWWNKGKASMPEKELGWRNVNNNKWEKFSPSREITDQMGRDAYSGGWDMTDQRYHEWALDGDVIKDLVLFYNETSDDAVKKEIHEEILYGVKGLLKNQEPTGRWRQGVVEGSYWLGTTAKLGSGLAAAARQLASSDAELASQAKKGAIAAWNYIYPKRLDRTLWAVKKQGKQPDGTTLNGWPQHHRHGYAGAYLEFAVELYLLNKNPQAKAVIDDLLSRARINECVGQFQHTSGDCFPGEVVGAWYSYRSDRAILAMIKYYGHATSDQKAAIMKMLKSYYRYDIYGFKTGGKRLNGPSGTYEGGFFKTNTGGQWQLGMRSLICGLLYDRFGPEFGLGVLVCERAFDHWTGLNPYATSLIFGVGDEFQVGGWSSYCTLGRPVGLLPSRGKTELCSSLTNGHGYMARETTAAEGVQLWLALTIFQKDAASMPKVVLYTEPNYTGEKVPLVAGEYLLRQLKAYGLDANSLSSLKVPAGFTVVLYDGDRYAGTSTTVTSDTANLGAMDNKTESLKITYTAPAGKSPAKATKPLPQSQ